MKRINNKDNRLFHMNFTEVVKFSCEYLQKFTVNVIDAGPTLPLRWSQRAIFIGDAKKCNRKKIIRHNNLVWVKFYLFIVWNFICLSCRNIKFCTVLFVNLFCSVSSFIRSAIIWKLVKFACFLNCKRHNISSFGEIEHYEPR